MKKLFVHQQLNQEYLGDHTPELGRYVYVVDKVVNSTLPQPRQALNKDEVDKLCNDEDWQVTIT